MATVRIKVDEKVWAKIRKVAAFKEMSVQDFVGELLRLYAGGAEFYETKSKDGHAIGLVIKKGWYEPLIGKWGKNERLPSLR